MKMISIALACVLSSYNGYMHSQLAPFSPVQPWANFSLETYGKTVSKYDYVLQLGYIPASEQSHPEQPPGTQRCDARTPTTIQASASIPIVISYKGKKPLALTAMPIGDRVQQSKWERTATTEQFESGADKTYTVIFDGDKGKLDTQELNAILFLDDKSIPVFTVTLDYLALPEYLVRTLNSGTLLSGPGSNWSPPNPIDKKAYKLETGLAPTGYTPEEVCYSLSGPRPCNGRGWVKCEVYERTEQNVAMEFSLQGTGAHRPVDGHAVVTVTYELKKSVPELF